MLPALFSIHDVMPETMERVQAILKLLHDARIFKVTLLVVPGKPWRQTELATLNRWSADGIELAGHGWVHECSRLGGWRHRLHSRLISRNVAEHLAISPAECTALMQRCRRWFEEQLELSPQLYVPPAWALNHLRADELRATGFTMVETLTGIVNVNSNRLVRLPLVGFEADTQLRRLILKTMNGVSVLWSRAVQKPLRVAIHPYDVELLLSQDLKKLACDDWNALSYTDWLESTLAA